MSDTRDDDWVRLVKETHKEEQERPPAPVPPPPGMRRRKRGFFLPVLLVASLVMVGLHLQGALDPWPPGPAATEAAAGQLAAMNLAARALHDYATNHGGQYPQELQSVLPLTLAIEYRPVPGGFELRSVGPDGKPIVVTSR